MTIAKVAKPKNRITGKDFAMLKKNKNGTRKKSTLA